MNWTELLRSEIDDVYRATDGLMEKAEGQALDWKPAAENNWMALGQLLMHLASATGAPSRGFATGDWGLPDGMDLSQMSPEEMIPPAEKMPTVESVGEARRLLAEDKETALAVIKEAGEERLESDPAPAPWDPRPMKLGHRLLQMVEHQTSHKDQLFLYLKLLGKPVNTKDLWGM